jgi:GAF domain-containing protein
VLPGDDATEVVAVVGNAEAREALLGTRNELGSWDELLDPRFERQGAYFVRAEEWPTGCTSYVPELRPSADPDGWLPEDALFVPMTGADGVLLGVISVDEPVWGRRPTDDELEVLVAVTGHAALALDAARARAAVVA